MADRQHEHGARDVEMGNAQHEQNGQREAGDICGICRMNQNQSNEPPNVQREENPPELEDGALRLTLHKAALKGEWEAAKSILERDDINVDSIVTVGSQTSLHVAAGAKHTDFVKKLVKMGANSQRKDGIGNTALCHAVMAGSIPVAKFLLDNDTELHFIRGAQDSIPLFIAVVFGYHDMAQLLFRKMDSIPPDHLEWEHRREISDIFIRCIENDMFDIALGLLSLRGHGHLAVARNGGGETALHLLARKPSAFDSKRSRIVKMLSNLCNYKESKDNTVLELVKKLWTNFLPEYTRENNRAENNNVNKFLFSAAELGNYKFLAILIQQYPQLVWETDEENRTIFHIAAMHRQANVFNQISIIGSIKDSLVQYRIPLYLSPRQLPDNILHLTAKMPLPHELNNVSGSALQMQQELLWFEEVKSILKPCDREKKGSENLTPRQVFSEKHEKLLEKAEKWMRETSTSCLIVATIITTVVYSAGFSIPGGFSTQGSPARINHTLFHVFVVSEAVALSSSITSTLIFLFILTSRYAEKDFIKSLPKSLMWGLATLFISITAMIISFSLAFFLAYMEKYNQNKLRWVPILVSGLALFPAASFWYLQYPLLHDIFNSTYRRALFRPKEPLFI